MECKLIQKGNAFYEIDDECMKKKATLNKSSNPASDYKKTPAVKPQPSPEKRYH